jgi:hypothetical protein
MKAKFFQFLLFIFIFSSCSNSKVISNQWVDYINSSTKESLLASKANHFLTNYDFKISNLLNETNKEDSVVIVTKTGKTFKGLVTKSDFDGYFIKIQNNREIYVSNIEIKTINFIKQPSNEVIDTLIKNTLETANNFNREIVDEESLQDSLNLELERKDNVWDDANSEFESFPTLEPEIVLEKSISNKVQEPFSVLSFIFTLLGFLTGIGFLLGMIFGAISLSNIKKNPEKFKGKGMAKFSFILSTVVVAAVLLLLLLIIGIFLLI